MLASKNMKKRTVMCLMFLSCVVPVKFAVAQDDQSTIVVQRLLQKLVDKGILNRTEAETLIKQSKIEKQADKELLDKDGKQIIRIPYITETLKQQMRDEIRLNLREDVVKDVLSQAKHERWGVPGVLPDWVDRLKFFGDIRLRAQKDMFGDDNSSGTYPNILKANKKGDTTKLVDPDDFYNTTVDRERALIRFRLGLKAKVTEGINVIARLTTGNSGNPVSTNQTLGNSLNKFTILLDRAYLDYKSETEYFTFMGGRMKNPWLSTDLVWDTDLNFNGVSATIRPRRTDNALEADEQNFDPFVTFGVLPLQELSFSNSDPSLLGVQIGFNWLFNNQSKFDFGVAYYDYQNITGILNPPNSNQYDYTALDVAQKGNTLYDINNDNDLNTFLYGLASDYNLIDVTLVYQIAQFAPTHIILTADYVKNIGYNRGDILRRTAGSNNILATGNDDLEEKTDAFLIKLMFGWPKIRKQGDWQVSLAYKKIERDAVLDAYTDSDFHLGGTDAKGWILGIGYGLADNTHVQFRWLTSDEIDGPPLSVDTLQLDLIAKF